MLSPAAKKRGGGWLFFQCGANSINLPDDEVEALLFSPETRNRHLDQYLRFDPAELWILIGAHERYLLKLEQDLASFGITVNSEGGLSARRFGKQPRGVMDMIEVFCSMREFVATLKAAFARTMV